MAKKVIRQALMAVLAPEDGESTGRRRSAATLPSLDERVELYLRAVHGSRSVSAQKRAKARLRILDAMADDLGGESSPAPSFHRAAAPIRSIAGGSDILTRTWDVLREALLWPLTLGAGQPMRLAAVSCAALLVVGGGWTATWFYAAQRTETAIASWIDQEAKAGRDYSCGSRSVGGFPLHVEVRCTALQAKVAMSDQSTLVVSAKSLRSVASIVSPSTLVTEFSGPVSISSSNQATNIVGNWSLAQVTLHGQPASPSQVSLVLDNPEFYRTAAGADRPLVAGGRVELDATAAGPALINIAAHAVDVSIPDGGSIMSRPFVADLSAVLHDAGQGAPQLLAQRLREWQSGGGHLEIAEIRIQQGDSTATGAGQIRLSANGRVDGDLRVSTAGLYERLAQSYIRDGQSGARERERLAQSALGGPRIHTRSLGEPESEQGADRKPRDERQRKQLLAPQGVGNLEIPIRFANGTVLLGRTDVGELPPLF